MNDFGFGKRRYEPVGDSEGSTRALYPGRGVGLGLQPAEHDSQVVRHRNSRIGSHGQTKSVEKVVRIVAVQMRDHGVHDWGAATEREPTLIPRIENFWHGQAVAQKQGLSRLRFSHGSPEFFATDRFGWKGSLNSVAEVGSETEQLRNA